MKSNLGHRYELFKEEANGVLDLLFLSFLSSEIGYSIKVLREYQGIFHKIFSSSLRRLIYSVKCQWIDTL